MRHGFAGCYQAVMVALILFVGLAAAAAAVDVFFVAPEDPDDDETRAGRRFIPINVGWVLIAGDSDGVDPESWAWDPDDKVTKVPEEPETATYTSSEPDEGAWVRVSASGESGPDTEETTKVVIYAADLDADAVTDPDPDPSGDPEEDPGLFIGAGDERQKITLATVPGDLLPANDERDLDSWDADLDVSGIDVKLWDAATGGNEIADTSWSAHWDGQQWVCKSGGEPSDGMPSQLWIQGDGPGTGSIGLDVYIRDACDEPPPQGVGAYDYIEYRVIAVDMDAQGVPIDEEEEHPGALVELGGTAELQINGPSYCSEPADGTLTLSWTNGARVLVYKDPEMTQQVTSGTSFTVADLEAPGSAWETLYVKGEQVSGSPRDVVFTLDYNGDGIHTEDVVNFTVLELRKIPLGGEADLSRFMVGKVYVPTMWGGDLELSSDAALDLYYTTGSDLDFDTACQIYRGEFNDPVASGNPCQYAVPQVQFRWYYVYRDAPGKASVSNSFIQEKTVTKTRWTCPWYPAADDQSPNLYDTGGCLDKYDTAYGSASRNRERETYCELWGDGHFVGESTLREQNAEVTLGYDIDNADGDGNVWTGWDDDYAYDFWDVQEAKWGHDNDTNAVVDASWWGHCNMATAAIIWEDEPTGNYEAPNGVVFGPSDKKGLLVALYHGMMGSDTGPDPPPHEWHSWLEQWILAANSRMLGCDVYNSVYGDEEAGDDDIVWNYPVYSIEENSYIQEPGQSDEKAVRVKCSVKYWDYSAGSSHTLYYWYNVTYEEGTAAASTDTDWMEHPDAPANKKRPDRVWMPFRQTAIDPYWEGELDYDTIATIIPLE